MRPARLFSVRFFASLRVRVAVGMALLAAVAAWIAWQAWQGKFSRLEGGSVQLVINGYGSQWELDLGLLLRCVLVVFVGGALLAGSARCDRWVRGAVARISVGALLLHLILYGILREVVGHDSPVPGLFIMLSAAGALLLAYFIQRTPLAAGDQSQLLTAARRRWLALLAFGGGCGAALAGAAWLYHWFPINLDTQSQLAQARLLNTGRFTLAVAPALQHALIFPWAVVGPQEYSLYPPGYILPLALEMFLRLPLHTFDVLAAGGTVLCAIQIARLLAPAAQRARAMLLTVLLLCASPQFVLMTGSMMNHTLTALLLTFTTMSFLTAWRRMRAGRSAWVWAFLGGVALGWGCATRPLTGVTHLAFWCGAAGLMLLEAVLLGGKGFNNRFNKGSVRAHLRLWIPALAGLGAALVVLGIYNLKTTGNFLESGYAAFDPLQHRLGFVPGAEGVAYTPWVALQNFIASVLSLNTNLLGWLIGSSVPLVVWWLRPAWPRRYLLLVALPLVQVAGYTLYHTHDLFFGPRFYFEFVPLLTIAAALGLASFFRTRGWSSRSMALALVLLCAGGFWGGIDRWIPKYMLQVKRAEQFSQFMHMHAGERPACITIRPDIAELCGMYFLGEPGRPALFIYRDKATALRQLPELQGYVWLDFPL